MPLRVSFRCFWPGFDAADFFLPLVESTVGEAPLRVEAGAPCDVEFVSNFIASEVSSAVPFRVGRRIRRLLSRPSKHGFPYATPSPQARTSIWFTGESLRPPDGDWDRTWTFDPDSEAARNTYAPLWLMLFPELLAPVHVGRSAQNRLGRELRVDEVVSPRESQVSSRPKFACMFTSRASPSRMLLARALSAVGEVDVYGLASGRPVECKLDVAGDYRFMICPENDLRPGYVTEKAFDAWGAGCLPIWSGVDVRGDLNPAAVLNAATAPSLDALVATVAALDADPTRMDDMGGRPLLLTRPSLDPLRRDLRELLGG